MFKSRNRDTLPHTRDWDPTSPTWSPLKAHHHNDQSIFTSRRRSKGLSPTQDQKRIIAVILSLIAFLTIYLLFWPSEEPQVCAFGRIAVLTMDIRMNKTKPVNVTINIPLRSDGSEVDISPVLTGQTTEKHLFLSSRALPNFKDYCDFHGYDFIVQRESLDNDRTIMWTKIKALQNYLPKYDWILWIDSDALIANPLITIEERVTECKDIYVSEDLNGLNLGVALFKNSEWTFDFLNRVYNRVASITHPWQEQHAFKMLLKEMWWWQRNQHVKIYPDSEKKMIQAYPHTNPKEGPGDYEEGDWILHVPGHFCDGEALEPCKKDFDTVAKRAKEILSTQKPRRE